ncbi:hypothetical protein H3N56_04135 [Cetobacterium sp. 2A]|uniref:hypothetical protein n=1 Tax=Cetobacterium sp. 2A TaxID=2754723 RepID=UPI00163BD1CD|nr:hypothetical protein [Cetobacterium sp. 2A]MBC2855687.1 hypothetical protein [Cetobacterium sp. 2A]
MEKYLISLEEKKEFLKEFPVLNCENSIGIVYDGYTSVKCKKITGTCTYRNSTGDEYKNCKILNIK